MPRLILTTYGVVRTETTLANKRFDRIILDEIHEIKSRRSKISKAIMLLQAPLRWGLSGTPVQNTSEETANLFRFILGLPTGTTQRINVPEMIRTHLLRRRKDVVLQDKIPELEIETVSVPFVSEREQQFYFKVQKNVSKEWHAIQEQGGSASAENVVMFELLMRLRQVSQHPQLVLNGFKRKFKRDFGRWTEHSSKHLALQRMIAEHPTESPLIFCQFTEEMDILERLFSESHQPTLRLDGKLSHSERQDILQQCQSEPQPPITMIQIKAGGVGLNLQAFSRVYLLSPDWNPCNEIQAMARAHRLGQTRKVIVTRLVLEAPEDSEPNSIIDERIMGVQERKRNLMADLLEEEQLRNNGRRRGKIGLNASDYGTLLSA